MSKAARLWVVASLALAGCPAPSPPPDAGADAGATIGCEGDPRLTRFSLPFTQATPDGAHQLRVTAVTPDPPARGNNTWQVQVLDAAGKVVVAPGLDVALFMPEHGHSSPTVPVITTESDAQQVSSLSFFMPGLWQLTFTLSADAGPSSAVVLHLCIAG